MRSAYPDAQPKRQLFIIAVLALPMGVAEGLVMAGQFPGAQLWEALAYVLCHFWIFHWYCHDSDAVGLCRSRWSNLGMVALQVIAVPWYVIRTRGQRTRWRAFLRFVGFVVLFGAIELAGVGLGGALG